MAFEVSQFEIGMKTVSPGGMKTDFFTRSFDTGKHRQLQRTCGPGHESAIHGSSIRWRPIRFRADC